VNPQRSTHSIAVPAGLQCNVLGEDSNLFLPAPLDRHIQPQGQAANVNAAILCWEWLRQDYPEMPAPMAVLKGQLHTALLEVEAELEEIREQSSQSASMATHFEHWVSGLIE